jgi:hypothetical protein
LVPAVSLTLFAGAKIGDFKVEYLREFEAICKKALTRESGAQAGLFDEKTRGRKSRDTVPLNLNPEMRSILTTKNI